MALSACNNSSDPPSLQITLNAPSGVSPSLVILGPSNFKQTITASTTLSSISAGNYYLLPKSYHTKGSGIADIAYSADPQTIAVSGKTQATVSYSQAPGSKKIWLGMDFPNPGTPLILGYDTNNLGSSNASLSASTQLGQDASVDGPKDIAFDAGGNLWIASFRQNQLVQYSVSQLGSNNPNLKPLRTLTSPDFDGPWGLAFDSEGGLWVSSSNTPKVVHFSAYALASADKTLSADRVLQGFSDPAGLAFDAPGNLWITESSTSKNQVLGFSPAKIASSGTPTPDFTLTGGTSTTPVAPGELAFDPSGNLWVSTVDYLFRYAKNTLSNASAKPNVQLQTDTPSYDFGAMAFDNQGNLWVTDFNGSTNLLLMYAPANQKSGQIKPDRSFSGPDLLHQPYGLAINPPPF